jgi:hypothetical protein
LRFIASISRAPALSNARLHIRSRHWLQVQQSYLIIRLHHRHRDEHPGLSIIAGLTTPPMLTSQSNRRRPLNHSDFGQLEGRVDEQMRAARLEIGSRLVAREDRYSQRLGRLSAAFKRGLERVQG